MNFTILAILGESMNLLTVLANSILEYLISFSLVIILYMAASLISEINIPVQKPFKPNLFTN
jgi:hypothetical protein